MRALAREHATTCDVCRQPAADTLLLEVCHDCLDDLEQWHTIARSRGTANRWRPLEVAGLVLGAWIVWLLPAAIVVAFSH